MKDRRRERGGTVDAGRAALLALSAIGLVGVDLLHLSIATGLGAVALAAFTIVYLTWWPASGGGLYGFLIAELSPLSLQSDPLTATIYQALCMAFLTGLIAPLPRAAKLPMYARPALQTLIIAGAALACGWILVTTTSLSPVQGASCVGIGILGVLTAIVYVRRHTLTRPVEV